MTPSSGTFAARRARAPFPPAPPPRFPNPAGPPLPLPPSCLSAPSNAELHRKSSSQSLAVSAPSSSPAGRTEPPGDPPVRLATLPFRPLVDGAGPALRPPEGTWTYCPGFGEVPMRGSRGWRRASRSTSWAEAPVTMKITKRFESSFGAPWTLVS